MNVRKLGLVVLVVFSFGCSITSMTPAHRMNAGEFTINMAVQEPGAIYLPQFGFGASAGLAYGDLSAEIATNFLAFRATIAPRLYLSDFGELRVEAAYWAPLGNEFTDNSFLTVVPRLGASLQGENGFYGGVQLPILLNSQPDTNETAILAGGYIGYGWRPMFSNWSYQVEFSGSPIGIQTEFFTNDEFILPAFQIGASAHFWIGRQRQIPDEEPPVDGPQKPRLL